MTLVVVSHLLCIASVVASVCIRRQNPSAPRASGLNSLAAAAAKESYATIGRRQPNQMINHLRSICSLAGLPFGSIASTVLTLIQLLHIQISAEFILLKNPRSQEVRIGSCDNQTNHLSWAECARATRNTVAVTQLFTNGRIFSSR